MKKSITREVMQVRKIFSCLICFYVGCTFSHAAEFQITGARVFGGSNVLISTNATKLSFTSQLSDDKKRITLTIKDAFISFLRISAS